MILLIYQFGKFISCIFLGVPYAMLEYKSLSKIFEILLILIIKYTQYNLLRQQFIPNYNHLLSFYVKELILVFEPIPQLIKKQQKKEMLKNQQENQKPLKILIIGNSGVGKSCMLMRYVENTFTTAFYNTIGVDFVTLTRYPQKIKNVEIDGRKVRLQIWDTAGQDRFRTITSTYYKGAHGIMLVYDVTDKQSFENLKFWLHEVEKFGSEGVDRIIVGNKCDQQEKRKVSYDEGFNFAKQLGLGFIEVSAQNSTHISEAFDLMTRKVLKKVDATSKTTQAVRIPQGQKLNGKVEMQKQSAGCCYF